MTHVIASGLRWLVRRLVRLYYPNIEITGRSHLPVSGPLLLVANHANSLIDPAILGLTARRPVRFFAKAPLFDTPVLGRLMRALGMLPAFRGQDDGAQVRRNLESITIGAEALARGETVGIFPEGKSHDALKLEQIRSGAARLATQAVALGAAELKIVPIGINYQRKQLFRSAIWIRVGRPITVRRFLAAHEDDRKGQRALTEEIKSRLRQVVIHLEEPAHEPFLDELELLLPPDRLPGHTPLSLLRQRKRLADALNYFHGREQAEARTESPGSDSAPVSSPGSMAQAITRYRAELASAGLNSRSPAVRFQGWRLAATLTVEALWLAYWFPAAMIGTAFHLLPFATTRALAARLQDGPTTAALSRLGLGLPIYALWYGGIWWALRSYFLPWVAWTVIAFMPMAGIFSLTYAHRSRDIFRNWLRQCLIVFQGRRLQELRAEQRRLRLALQSFVEEYTARFPSLADRPQPFSWRRRVKVTLRWAGILLLAASVFVWQNWFLARREGAERLHGLNLAGLKSDSLRPLLEADERALGDILTGLADLETQTKTMMAEFASGRRDWYRQADDDALRSRLLTYVNYRTALLRLIWKYQDYAATPEESLRLRAFLVGYTAASALYEASLKFVTLFDAAPNAVRKLNEPEPLWQIPPNLYDSVRHSLADASNRQLLARAAEFYRRHQDGFARFNLTDGPFYARCHETIRRSELVVRDSQLVALSAGVSAPLQEARDAGKDALYRAQTFISTWIGDTKIREPHGGKALIQPEQVRTLRTRLKPGDVMLERRNWFLSNAFLPGYWPHSALYVGTAEDLRRLGLDRDPRVQRHWEKFRRHDDRGHERVIIEAISEGVVFTSLEHSVGEADAAAFLRPNLPEERLKEVIARAFSHAGKPYDFEFDFFSTDKLVCSEVVYRAFDGDIQLPLVDVMGRKTLPPIEIVRQCAGERRRPGPQFAFVAFLDGFERKGRAEFVDEEAFYQTLERPGLDLAQPRR